MNLQDAITADNVDELYCLIQQDETLLDCGPESSFGNTPLHDAADQGSTKVAMEITILKPSFTSKLNRGGHSPMHLALRKKHYHTARALMALNPELIRVQGRGGITPLHFVAGEIGGNDPESAELLELLAEFLHACKSSIKDLTNQCETAFHIAVKTGNIEAFKVLFGWLKRVRLTQILKWKDENGNTALHIAALQEKPEFIKLLIGYTNVMAKNIEGKTVVQIFREKPSGDQDLAERLQHLERRASHLTPTLSLSQFLSTGLSAFEKHVVDTGICNESTREVILIVATLIAAATYQAALAPPGGYWQDSSSNPTVNSTVVTANSSSIALEKPHRAGNYIMSDWKLHWFTIWNTLAFSVSVAIIVLATLNLERSVMIFAPMSLLCFAYFVTLSIPDPQSTRADLVLFTVLVICLLFVIFSLPMYLWIKHKGVRRRIDARGRCVANFLVSKDRK